MNDDLLDADGSPPGEHDAPGFRLDRLELLNWGTFDQRVWTLDMRGDTGLVTGDIGSGKSTVVDAITTLLVPPQRQQYNRAAGADARERTARSYMLGVYKSERRDGAGARPVALRDPKSYSVLLACFVNGLSGERVTLAQVLWMDSPEGQPARLYAVADRSLGIKDHFSGFGTEIASLKKRLKKVGIDYWDTFPPYGIAFRRRLGIDNEQALSLFQQTVSMKSVGNLTEFVREHMLEPCPIQARIDALLGHFDALQRAHDAVLKARAQVDMLTPLVAMTDDHARQAHEIDSLRAARDVLSPWFASIKADLLDRRIGQLDEEQGKLARKIEGLRAAQAEDRRRRDAVRIAISAAGGDRIENIKDDIRRLGEDRDRRRSNAERFDSLAKEAGFPPARDAESFDMSRNLIKAQREALDEEERGLQPRHMDAVFEFKTSRTAHEDLVRDLEALRRQPSNMPRSMLELRAALCEATSIDVTSVPFAGELLQVHPKEVAWEGAIERLLRGFALSMLVRDADYERVSEWVERTHLGERFRYVRVREGQRASSVKIRANTPAGKLQIQEQTPFYHWIEAELATRFELVCCDTIEQFRREASALTRSGQIKTRGDRHEKDDRYRIDDRRHFVLGWTNTRKIAALDKDRKALEATIGRQAENVAKLKQELDDVRARMKRMDHLAHFESFAELDWRTIAGRILELEAERNRLESSSDQLGTLEKQLGDIDRTLEVTGRTVDDLQLELGQVQENVAARRLEREACIDAVSKTPDGDRARWFPVLEGMQVDALGRMTLLLEKCDDAERTMTKWLQGRIDAGTARLTTLGQSIVRSMQAYCKDYPADTTEVDARIEAAPEYRRMLGRLREDDLPRFEGRFKQLLNENTIREIAGFQSELRRERETIKERIERINASLYAIDYNPGRYIELQTTETTDVEIRDFRQDLRTCTEGTLAGSDEVAYTEEKFLQVKRILERFRGREGRSEVDRKWTQKVTDVREWFTFSASERYREDRTEHEHYADSGGKSGGQKEKLAYTVLAASLAYQFGLERGKPKTFRFVVIDEAFGRGSDESARFALKLFRRLGLQLLIITPLQKIHVIEPFVASVGFVYNEDGRSSKLRNLSIDEFRAERAARTA